MLEEACIKKDFSKHGIVIILPLSCTDKGFTNLHSSLKILLVVGWELKLQRLKKLKIHFGVVPDLVATSLRTGFCSFIFENGLISQLNSWWYQKPNPPMLCCGFWHFTIIQVMRTSRELKQWWVIIALRVSNPSSMVSLESEAWCRRHCFATSYVEGLQGVLK